LELKSYQQACLENLSRFVDRLREEHLRSEESLAAMAGGKRQTIPRGLGRRSFQMALSAESTVPGSTDVIAQWQALL
jgi:hypothetical protein